MCTPGPRRRSTRIHLVASTARGWARTAGRRNSRRGVTYAGRPPSWRRSRTCWWRRVTRRHGYAPSGSADNGTGGRMTTFVDGNEMAGPLRELFAMDVTMARGRCAGCGLTSEVAETHVYPHAPGL